MSDLADIAITKYLAENGYHPRSSKHGDALCTYFLNDLLRNCPEFRRTAESGAIVFQRNYTVDPKSPTQWNVDLVIGPPEPGFTGKEEKIGPLGRGNPREIWIAVDAKTIMTEHGKARRNRQRDLNSFQDILHRKNPKTIAAGLLLVNMAARFQTPLLRRSGGLNNHRNIERLVAEIVTLLGGLPRCGSAAESYGLEALGVIVISHSNIPKEPTLLINQSPAPSIGQALDYRTFLQEICETFTARYGQLKQ